jgi:hypothetical protein
MIRSTVQLMGFLGVKKSAATGVIRLRCETISSMPDSQRKERALQSLAKYRQSLTSDERIAAFAAWFAEEEFGWKDARKHPPTDMMLVLLKDSKLNVVRMGYRTGGGGWSIQEQPARFVPQFWARIP